MFEERKKPTTRNPNQKRAALWRIFSTNIQTVIPTKQEVGFIFV
jgi:hypothetical protein